MLQVGYCYFQGIRIKKDNHWAFIWYKESADMNNSNRIFQADFCYYNMIGVKIDKHQVFEHYQKSAEINNFNRIMWYWFLIFTLNWKC